MRVKEKHRGRLGVFPNTSICLYQLHISYVTERDPQDNRLYTHNFDL